MGVIRFQRNPLVYPAGVAAGFDPTHIASDVEPVLSAIVIAGGNFLNVQTLVDGVLTGAPAGGISAGIGPGVSFSGTQNISLSTPSMMGATAPATMAAIVQTPSTTSSQVVCRASNGNILNLSLNNLQYKIGTGALTNLLAGIASSTPYFLAFSTNGVSGGPICGVATNLQTGQITFASATVNASATGAATAINVGNNAGGTTPFLGQVAAVMAHGRLLSLATLLYWAANPWLFWYPVLPRSFVGAVPPSVIFRKTLSQIGGRVGSRQPQYLM